MDRQEPRTQVEASEGDYAFHLPLGGDEDAETLAACQDYPDKLNRICLKALVLLLRHSLVRIRDAVTLSLDRISEDELFLRP